MVRLPAPPNVRRRTQAERREETIGRLVQATVDCLAETGYAATTTAAVAHRAGLSQGALFRHFRTRQDLLVAAADHVTRLQVALFRERFGGVRFDPANAEDVVLALGRLVNAPANRTWHELVFAARSDAELRAALGPAVETLNTEVMRTGAAYFGDRVRPAELGPLLSLILNFFDGTAMSASVARHPELGQQAGQLLAGMIVHHLAGADS